MNRILAFRDAAHTLSGCQSAIMSTDRSGDDDEGPRRSAYPGVGRQSLSISSLPPRQTGVINY